VKREEGNNYILFSTFDVKDHARTGVSFSLHASHKILKKWRSLKEDGRVKLLDYMKTKTFLVLEKGNYSVKIETPVVVTSVALNQEAYDWVSRQMKKIMPCCGNKSQQDPASADVMTPLLAAIQ
jgi:S-adenosylmethionine synthetase